MSAELNFHQLYLFYAVARLGSVSQAAEKLHISQPAISAQVKELEQMLAVPLLQRLPRGVALTDAGRVVFDYARRLFTLTEELQTAVQDLRGLRAGSLSIGGSLTAGEYFLPGVTKRFKERYPAVELVLVLGNSADILARIARRELALGIIGADVATKGLAAVPCWAEEIVIVAAPASPWVAQQPLTLAQLQSQPFVMREEGSGTRQTVEMWLQKRGLAVQMAMVVGSPEAVKRHVAAGMGFGFASRCTVAAEVKTGQLAIVAVDGWECRQVFSVAYRQNEPLSLPQQAFLDLLLREERAPEG
jgi:molybdate transport repressor ModE-like protein